MSPKETSVTLDGVVYRVPSLNIGQLESVAETFEGPRSKIPFGILRIALTRAIPTADLNTLTPTMDEIADAVKAILVTAGLQKSDENPPPPLKVVRENG